MGQEGNKNRKETYLAQWHEGRGRDAVRIDAVPKLVTDGAACSESAHTPVCRRIRPGKSLSQCVFTHYMNKNALFN